MTKSTTRMITVAELHQKGDLGVVLARLMMACNDMTLAEDAVGNWQREEAPSRKGRRVGAQMYFMRLQIGHLYEAMDIVKQIEKDRRFQLDVE